MNTVIAEPRRGELRKNNKNNMEGSQDQDRLMAVVSDLKGGLRTMPSS